MAQSGEQPMQIEHRRSARANGAASGAAEEAEKSKAPVPTSLMLFQSLVALRPEYLGIRLAEREANLAEMRRMHEQARDDTQLVPIREQQQGNKQEEMETKRRRLLKQQWTGIRLWEAERDDMAAEQQSLRYHGSAWVEPSNARPTAQDTQQLTALRNALRSHFCQHYEVTGDASAQQLEIRIVKHKYIIVLSNMVSRSPWQSQPSQRFGAAVINRVCFVRRARAIRSNSGSRKSLHGRRGRSSRSTQRRSEVAVTRAWRRLFTNCRL